MRCNMFVKWNWLLNLWKLQHWRQPLTQPLSFATDDQINNCGIRAWNWFWHQKNITNKRFCDFLLPRTTMETILELRLKKRTWSLSKSTYVSDISSVNSIQNHQKSNLTSQIPNQGMSHTTGCQAQSNNTKDRVFISTQNLITLLENNHT